jgi:hypothetical protein
MRNLRQQGCDLPLSYMCAWFNASIEPVVAACGRVSCSVNLTRRYEGHEKARGQEAGRKLSRAITSASALCFPVNAGSPLSAIIHTILGLRIYKISSGLTTTQFLSAVTSLPLAICACVLFLISSCNCSKYASLRLIHRCTPPFPTSTPWNCM